MSQIRVADEPALSTYVGQFVFNQEFPDREMAFTSAELNCGHTANWYVQHRGFLSDLSVRATRCFSKIRASVRKPLAIKKLVN